MDKITVGVLTVSDRCERNEAVDESGPNLTKMIKNGAVKNAEVVITSLVPDCKKSIEEILKKWCEAGIHLILTTGGTGIEESDCTPEATMSVVTKTVPGIWSLIFKKSMGSNPLAALSRGVAGVRQESLIINLPGSKKGSKECLEAVAEVIPHAVDLITGRKHEIEHVHGSLKTKKSSAVMKSRVSKKKESLYPFISVSLARKIVTKTIFLLKKEKNVNYKETLGYVLAQDVVAREHLPPFDASMKDGYAFVGSDTGHRLEVTGIAHAGCPPLDVEVVPGCCVKISTGAYLPPGANAVVQVEDIESDQSCESGEKEAITLLKRPHPEENIRPRGADYEMGERVLKFGTCLDSSGVGLLAAVGARTVRVFDKPVVAVISTGDELVDPEEELQPGKVRDSNRITLLALLKEENFRAVDLGIAPDAPDDLRSSLEKGFEVADVVVTTGSMSMGDRDYLKEVLVADFNANILFGGVKVKPGKPTSFANLTFEGKPKLWFGLPGNPVSAFVTAHLFLLPGLRKISGREAIFPISVTATVNEPVLLEERPQYVRGILTYDEDDESWTARVTGDQRSSRIASCINANCLLEFPSKEFCKEGWAENSGKKVKALLIGKSYI